MAAQEAAAVKLFHFPLDFAAQVKIGPDRDVHLLADAHHGHFGFHGETATVLSPATGKGGHEDRTEQIRQT